jgi:hypothetical protein
MSTRWYAGIEWAERHHEVVVSDETGERIAGRRVAHSAAGLSELTAWLRTLGAGGGGHTA